MKTMKSMKKLVVMTMAVMVATVFLFTEVSFADTDNQFSSVSAAGQYLEQEMMNHESKVTLTVTSSNSNPNTVTTNVLNAAFADNANNASELGDYVKYSLYNGSSTNYSYYKNSNGTYTYTLKYSISYKITAAQSQAFEKKLSSVMSSLNLNGKSNYQKAKIIYNYITKNVSYDYKSSSYTKYSAYAALNTHKAVCQGYATLYYRMAKAAGLSTRVVTGIGGGDKHAWNIVKVGSKYYNADATWDAGSSHYSYFLKSDKGMAGHSKAAAFKTSSFKSAQPMSSSNY